MCAYFEIFLQFANKITSEFFIAAYDFESLHLPSNRNVRIARRLYKKNRSKD